MTQQIGEVLTERKSSCERIWEEAANGCSGMDRAAFVELMNGLWSGMGRNAMPDKTTLRVWYLCLHDISVQQFGRAVQRYLTERSSEFVTVQLIRELSGIQQSGEEASVVAWDMALRAITIVGSYAVPDFPDAAVSHVISNLGGWDWFCDQKPDALRSFVRPQFLRAYAAFSKMPRLMPVRLKSLIEKSGGRSDLVRIADKSEHARLAAD